MRRRPRRWKAGDYGIIAVAAEGSWYPVGTVVRVVEVWKSARWQLAVQGQDTVATDAILAVTLHRLPRGMRKTVG